MGWFQVNFEKQHLLFRERNCMCYHNIMQISCHYSSIYFNRRRFSCCERDRQFSSFLSAILFSKCLLKEISFFPYLWDNEQVYACLMYLEFLNPQEHVLYWINLQKRVTQGKFLFPGPFFFSVHRRQRYSWWGLSIFYSLHIICDYFQFSFVAFRNVLYHKIKII